MLTNQAVRWMLEMLLDGVFVRLFINKIIPAKNDALELYTEASNYYPVTLDNWYFNEGVATHEPVVIRFKKAIGNVYGTMITKDNMLVTARLFVDENGDMKPFNVLHKESSIKVKPIISLQDIQE